MIGLSWNYWKSLSFAIGLSGWQDISLSCWRPYLPLWSETCLRMKLTQECREEWGRETDFRKLSLILASSLPWSKFCCSLYCLLGFESSTNSFNFIRSAFLLHHTGLLAPWPDNPTGNLINDPSLYCSRSPAKIYQEPSAITCLIVPALLPLWHQPDLNCGHLNCDSRETSSNKVS